GSRTRAWRCARTPPCCARRSRSGTRIRALINTSVDRRSFSPQDQGRRRRENNMNGIALQERADLDDLLSEEATNDPFAYYAKRRQETVRWTARWKGWVAPGYEPVIAGYRDADRLSSDRFSGPFGAEMRRSETTFAQLIQFLSRFFVWKDPPF